MLFQKRILIGKRPINVFGNNYLFSGEGNISYTSLFVQKLYLRIKKVQSNMEENVAPKNQIRIRKLTLSHRKYGWCLFILCWLWFE